MSDADAATNRRFARDAAAERPRADDGGQHDEAISGALSQEHPRAGRVEYLAHDDAPPAQREAHAPVGAREPRGQRDGGSFGVGELIDELVDLTPPLLVEARF